MPTKSELMHYRLQAWLRENQCDEFEYLGERPDALGVPQHWYRIADHEVTVDQVEELELMDDAESAPLCNLQNIYRYEVTLHKREV